MARYFMHLVDGDDTLLDPDGVEATDETVKGMALKCARDCIAGDAHRGLIKLSYRIEVQDEAGTVVYSLPFSDAVTIEDRR
jgi:hypothetical protein